MIVTTSSHTESIGDVDLVEVAAHYAQSRRGYKRQVEFGEKSGFVLWHIECWPCQRLVCLRSLRDVGCLLDQRKDFHVFFVS